MIKVGINGFGRIGRVVFRILCERSDEFEICGINLRNADPEYMAYLLKYDSIFGNFPGDIKAEDGKLVVNGKKITVFSYSELSEIPWRDCGAEYVIESTGAFLTKETAGQHLVGGAKKVIVTAPAKDDMPTFVMGVNNETYDPSYDVVSNASCTTNCLAPMAKVLNDKFGIKEGLMSTIHSSTSKQKPVDARAGRDWRTGRSLINNIIPSTTGAAKACGLVIPELQGKLTGMSFRVPVNDVSIVDMTILLETPTTYEEICAAMKEASEGSFKGIIEYLDEPVVSSDLRSHSATCIFDSLEGIMLNDHFVKLLAWYDNEWGYSSKVVDLVKHVHDHS